jgi:DNA-binding MarR family transcriptional regulator
MTAWRSAVDGEDPEVGDRSLTFVEFAINRTEDRLPTVDVEAMRMVLLLTRVSNAVVYDLESSVHRPAGWSWSAFRLLFTLWNSGPVESKRAARLAGMSRAAVSSLTKTLVASGLLTKVPDVADGRAVLLAVSQEGADQLSSAFLEHNKREAEWASVLTPDERSTLNALLGKLSAAGQQGWVSRRR